MDLANLLTVIDGGSRIIPCRVPRLTTTWPIWTSPTLQQLRETILEVIPEAEEGISYRLPAFRLQGKVVAGFAAFKNHLSYLPHRGSVFPQLEKEVAAYRTSSGALQFPVDTPLPKPLAEKLVSVRIAQAFPNGDGFLPRME
jgi:uncharacterized protein YdhG (YjbR/CyaY superfamily)